VELTGDHTVFLPLLVAATVAHGFTVLTMRRSILTEKVARRGFHVTREYAVDPLDVLLVGDVMQTAIVGLPASASSEDIERLLDTKLGALEPLYPILEGGTGRDGNGNGNARFIGVVTRRRLLRWTGEPALSRRTVRELATANPVTAYVDEPLCDIVRRMAETGHTRLPVVARDDRNRLLGAITLVHTLDAKRRHLEEEGRRERVLRLGLLVPSVLRPRRPPSSKPARLDQTEPPPPSSPPA
jgi:CIC family chloride channel protein